MDEDDDRPLELPIIFTKRAHKQSRRRSVVPPATTESNNGPADEPIATPRDPRFDPRCSGSADRRHFVRNYSFLNEAKQAEMQELQIALKSEQDPDKRDKIKATIARFRNKMIDPEHEFNAKKPRGKHKKLELAQKFKHLKESGKLTKYLERKRKKLLKRDQKSFG